MSKPQAEDWRARLAALMPEGDDTNIEAPVESAGVAQESNAKQKGRLDIVFERKGRAGKCATIVCGFDIDDDAIEALASKMKRRLGCGGSVRGGEILIQGDKRNEVLRFLQDEGYKAKSI